MQDIQHNRTIFNFMRITLLLIFSISCLYTFAQDDENTKFISEDFSDMIGFAIGGLIAGFVSLYFGTFLLKNNKNSIIGMLLMFASFIFFIPPFMFFEWILGILIGIGCSCYIIYSIYEIHKGI